MTPATIARIAPPTPEEFEARWVRTSTPVIIQGLMDTWPARRLWSLDYFDQRFGKRLVTAGTTRDGMLEMSDEKGVHQVEIEFGQYVEQLRRGRVDCYVLSPVDERLPELLDDVVAPEAARRARWHAVRLWFGAGGTCSPLHRDWPENLFGQVLGHKRVIMVHRKETPRVYRRPFWSGVPNFSRLDAEHPDYDRFPRFRDVSRLEFEVGPGDVLYIPRMWWHQVRSLDTSASINFWFANGAVAAVARASQLYAKLRGLRK
jgi:hypothetical protein